MRCGRPRTPPGEALQPSGPRGRCRTSQRLEFRRSTGEPLPAAERGLGSPDPLNLIWVMPAKGGRMEREERTWGVTPVPERLRTLSGLDVGLLWGSLGISLLVLAAGTYLAALGLAKALLAIGVGAVLGCALLGLAGLIGADRRVAGLVVPPGPPPPRGAP